MRCEAGFGRWLGKAQRIGDLGIAHALGIVQHQRQAQALGKLFKRHGQPGVLWRHRLFRNFLHDNDAPVPATGVVAGIDEDACHPGAEIAGLTQGMAFFPGLQRRVLQRITAGVVILQNGIGYAVEHGVMRLKPFHKEVLVHSPTPFVTLHPLDGSGHRIVSATGNFLGS